MVNQRSVSEEHTQQVEGVICNYVPQNPWALPFRTETPALVYTQRTLRVPKRLYALELFAVINASNSKSTSKKTPTKASALTAQ